ncbi:putative endonuclease lcl3 [Pyricularia oryzae]|nr:putative endonuclease lcl3 [Pyricularia oryzae]
MMRWPWSSDSSDGPKPARHWNESLNKTDWEHYKEPRNWVPTAIATTTILAAVQFYRSYLRRIPGTNYIHPGFFRRRSLFGRVTSVGDGDNFHLFHTPGGRLAGWSWLRSIPTERKALKGKTIPVRIAGVDAPEAAISDERPSRSAPKRWSSSSPTYSVVMCGPTSTGGISTNGSSGRCGCAVGSSGKTSVWR